ncbi:penicillin-binding transpeptidase domain-containing protein [Arthrobacter sp. zg-Y750]|uniref:penicillin-binding transpeptidase domain-containing protein n=1 Tax=Arthrobacter sp. zg-Y750 TaxID=2894189 RepID=UPI001E5E6A63|nr:penicillin-binding transpeptidase domain-containing protein [Arthrobacter sp. zg-Y750]MCC9176577.1 penicillin-binding protein [Arthrobacter sp. zg-Y750]
MGKNRTPVSVLAVAALALSLVSCSADKPSPDDAAATLAEGLGNLDVSGSAFTAGTPDQINKELQTLLADMGPLRPDVTVAGVDEDPDDKDTASAKLGYAWDVNGDSRPDWNYESTVQLERGEDDQWLVQWAPSVLFDSLADGDRLARATVPPPARGDILDRNGAPLMTSRPVLRIGINKPDVPEGQEASSAAALAALVGLDPEAYTAQVQASGPEAFVEALVQRAEADGPATVQSVEAIPGAAALPAQRILAPTRSFARALLGTVGEATAEAIAESEGRLSAGDLTGLSGLQQQYDEQLRGSDGVSITVESASGSKGVFATDALSGTDVQTTLDPRLQELAEAVLEGEPSASALVAIQPSTGDILTVANGPGSEGQQTALLGQYPPGSTFKTASALAMLRNGVTPESTVQCPAELNVDGRNFANVPGYPANATGDIPLRTAFANSCNTAFLNARDTVSQQALADAAADLGIGVDAAIGTPAFLGSVPAEAEGTAHAASLIGQGEVLVSPLAMAVAGASISKGERVAPALVRPVAGTEGTAPAASAPADPSAGAKASAAPSASESAAPAPAPSKLTAAEAASLREMMRAVVAEGGVQMLLDVPGDPVLAKSGTAEFGGEDPPQTHAWVLSIQGDLAVAVFVEQGERGSTSGGPLMKQFLTGARG